MEYAVLINNEEQYALYPVDLGVPAGWRESKFTGSQEQCMAYVDEHWTDMRPLSLRRALDAAVELR